MVDLGKIFDIFTRKEFQAEFINRTRTITGLILLLITTIILVLFNYEILCYICRIHIN
jgi:hypothetical protein